MRYIAVCLILIAVATAPLVAEEPISTDKVEKVEVRLILVETVVLDSEGRALTDLQEDEFQLAVEGAVRPVDTFDTTCPSGRIRSEDPRRMVLVVDYVHLDQRDRRRVLQAAAMMMGDSKSASDEIMIAALTERLRIEQRFTPRADDAIDTLERMEYDTSLFARDFSGVTGKQYLKQLSTLMDVLAAYEGPKSVVLFSALLSRADVTESDFEDVAQRAAAARAVVYPAYAQWFNFIDPRQGRQQTKDSAGGQRALARLATDTGGMVSPRTDDLSLSYRQARRELVCRYTLGFLVEEGSALTARDVRVSVRREGAEVRYPRRVRLWSDEEQRQSRLTAAFADPEQFEHPLVRVLVHPVRPRNGSAWDTLVALHFPMPIDPGGSVAEIRATLARSDSRKVEEFTRQIEFPAPQSGQPSVRQVTFFGDSKVRPGEYSLTVALSKPGGTEVVTARSDFRIPEVPRKGIFVGTPIVARVVKDALLIRADESEQQEETQLDRVLADSESFEPLVVHEIAPTDDLLFYWDACAAGGTAVPARAVVERRIVGGNGKFVHRMESLPYAPEQDGKARCQGKLERVPGDTLAAGRYTIEVVVAGQKDGEILSSGTTPLLVD